MADAAVRFKPSARAGNPLSLMTTELNALGSAAGVISAVLSNDAADELDLYVDLELTVTYAVAPTENSLVEVYIVRSVDGTNYEDASAEGRPKHGYVGGFVLDNVTSAQRIILPEVRLPPDDFKLYVVNKAGTAMPATGTVIKGLFYTEQADE